MTEIGRIVKLKDSNAVVRFYRRGKCDGCGICSVIKDGAYVELELENSLELSVDDYVKVEIYNKRVFRTSMLIYLLPLFLTAIGAGVGSLASVGAGILIALAGLVVGFAFAIPIDVFVLRKKNGYKPRMLGACREVDYLNSKPEKNYN